MKFYLNITEFNTVSEETNQICLRKYMQICLEFIVMLDEWAVKRVVDFSQTSRRRFF